MTRPTKRWQGNSAVQRCCHSGDCNNLLIRKITPSGQVITLAGSGTMGSINDAGTLASFAYPYGVAVDGSGNVYVADTNNHLIRKISAK